MTLSITAASAGDRDLGAARRARHFATTLNRRLVAVAAVIRRRPASSHQSSALRRCAVAAADDDNFSEELRSWRLPAATADRPSSLPRYSGRTRPGRWPLDDVVQLPVGRKNRNQDL